MRNHKAFSLMEVLLVIAIIGIMVTAGFVSLNSGKSQAKLQAAQREVASAIKLTQSYALQGKVVNGATPCGYGFRFDPTDTTNKKNYEIFYNTASGMTCDVYNAVGAVNRQYNADSHMFQSLALGNGVAFNSTAPDLDIYTIPNPNTTEIYFTIPGGNIYGYNGNAYTTRIFTFNLAGNTKTITIDSGGSITEQ